MVSQGRHQERELSALLFDGRLMDDSSAAAASRRSHAAFTPRKACHRKR